MSPYLGPLDFFSKKTTYNCSSALNENVPGEKRYLVHLKNVDAPTILTKNGLSWAKMELFCFFGWRIAVFGMG